MGVYLYIISVHKDKETVRTLDCEYGETYEKCLEKCEGNLEEIKTDNPNSDIRIVTEKERDNLTLEVCDNTVTKTWKIRAVTYDDPYCAPYINDYGLLECTHREAMKYCMKWGKDISDKTMDSTHIECVEYEPLPKLLLDTPPFDIDE